MPEIPMWPAVRMAALSLAALAATAVTAVPAPPDSDPIVGRFAGQEVRASEILDRCARQLDALSDHDDRAYVDAARHVITSEMHGFIIDRVIRIEAERELTDEEREELPAFEQTLRTKLVGPHGGDQAATDRHLRETTGVGLEATIAKQRADAIVRRYFDRHIGSRIVVDEAAIERAYRRQHRQFVTPEARTVRLISTPDSRAAERIGADLAAGRSFVDIASGSDNTFKSAVGGLVGLPVTDPASLRGPLADAVVTLAAGETSPRLDDGDQFTWVHVEAIEPGHTVPLEKARETLVRELRSRQQTKLTNAHFADLLGRFDLTDTGAMIERTVSVAEQQRTAAGIDRGPAERGGD